MANGKINCQNTWVGPITLNVEYGTLTYHYNLGAKLCQMTFVAPGTTPEHSEETVALPSIIIPYSQVLVNMRYSGEQMVVSSYNNTGQVTIRYDIAKTWTGATIMYRIR